MCFEIDFVADLFPYPSYLVDNVAEDLPHPIGIVLLDSLPLPRGEVVVVP